MFERALDGCNRHAERLGNRCLVLSGIDGL